MHDEFRLKDGGSGGVSKHLKPKTELKIRTYPKHRFENPSPKPKSADTQNPIGYPKPAFVWKHSKSDKYFL